MITMNKNLKMSVTIPKTKKWKMYNNCLTQLLNYLTAVFLLGHNIFFNQLQ